MYDFADSRKRPYPSDVARALKSTEARDAFEALMHGTELQPPQKVSQELRALAQRRRHYEKAQTIARLYASGDVDGARELSLELAADGGSEKRTGEYMHASEAIAYARDATRKQGGAMRTGWPLIDKAIGQLRPSTLTVIGGYEGTRKSSMMLGMAMNFAARGIPCGIISLEDPAEVWGPRVLAHVADLNPRAFDGPRGEEFEKTVNDGILTARDLGIYFAFEEQQPLNKVLAAMRYLARKSGVKAVFVDYLQCFQDRSENRAQFISYACAKLKAQAQRLGVALILGSQLNNPERGKEFRQPNNTSLKESGDIKDKAEVVILLWKASDEDNGVTLGKISKCKWSPDRPRFQIETNPNTGCVVGMSHVE